MDNPIPYEADDYYEGDDRTPDQLEIDGLWQEIRSLRAQLENNKKAKAIRRKTIATLMAENKSLRQERDEAREAYRQLTKQADAFHSENARLREQLRKARITTVARICDEDIECEGDGSGPGCENDAVWEIQAMDASGSHYSYVCSKHLDSYQKWADDDGRSPMVFELED